MRPEPVNDLDYEKKFAIPGDRYHRIIQYSDSVFKVVQFYSTPCLIAGPKADAQHSDVKLSSSISRTKRSILDYALSNDWDYFITMTLNEERVDRFDLEAWHKKFREWLKYRRKRYGLRLNYLLVPEQHADGAWHAHGFIRALSPLDLVSFKSMDEIGYLSENGKRLSRELVNSGYLNWPDYQRSFGFCSLGPIKSQEAASFYVTKYITKDLARCVSTCGKHMYWHSAGLNKPQLFGEFVTRYGYLDRLLVNKYEYCATGIVLSEEGWCSDLVAGMIESVDGVVFSGCRPHPIMLSDPEPSPPELEADNFYQACFMV